MALGKYVFILATLLIALDASAAPKKRTRLRPAPKAGAKVTAPSAQVTPATQTNSAASSSTAAPRSTRRPDTSAWKLSMLLWQEIIDLESGADTAKMIAQSQGLQASYVWNRPFRGQRWSWTYSLDAGAGTIKGKGDNAAIPDTFANQAWLMLGGSVGLVYRTSIVSSLHFMLPVTYRTISWKLSAGSATDPNRDSSFSAGFTGAFGTQVTPRSQILFGFTHQQMWQATQWSVSWQTAFR